MGKALVIGARGFLGGVGGDGSWARETLTKTACNRAMGRALVYLVVAQLSLGAGASLLGLGVRLFEIMVLFLWFFSA